MYLSSLSHFLRDKGKKRHIYSYRICYIFLIYNIIIYLLYVLIVFKMEGIFGKKNSAQKS